MSEWSAECQAANRIAAQLRGTVYKRAKAKIVVIKRERQTATIRRGVTLATPETVYAFAINFFAENDHLPTAAHVADGMHVAVQTAHAHLMTLARLGFIEKNSVGKYRFCREEAQ